MLVVSNSTLPYAVVRMRPNWRSGRWAGRGQARVRAGRAGPLQTAASQGLERERACRRKLSLLGDDGGDDDDDVVCCCCRMDGIGRGHLVDVVAQDRKVKGVDVGVVG